MRIPLPKMMRHWREREFEKRLTPGRRAVRARRLGAGGARGRGSTGWRRGSAARRCAALGGGRGRLPSLPLAGGWTGTRDMPAPEGRTFMDQWAAGPAVSARERILARVRSGRPAAGGRAGGGGRGAARRASGAGRCRARRGATGAGGWRSSCKAEAAAATVGRVSSLAELPKALAHELRKRNLPAAVRSGRTRCSPGWTGARSRPSQGVGRIEEPATLSRAEFALAETGTLVLASGPDNPVTLTFLGETHFVVLRDADICGGFEDFWARVARARARPAHDQPRHRPVALGRHRPGAAARRARAGGAARLRGRLTLTRRRRPGPRSRSR